MGPLIIGAPSHIHEWLPHSVAELAVDAEEQNNWSNASPSSTGGGG